MNDFIYTFSDAQALLADCMDFLNRDKKKIRYINVKWMDEAGIESRWYYNVYIQQEKDDFVIYNVDEYDEAVRVPLNRLKQLKIRPYYYAACVGFKNIVFCVNLI